MNVFKFLKGLFLVAWMLFVHSIMAQSPTGYYVEAAKFSQTYTGGSARFQGFAGAGSALGGDLTSAALNPAGLGLYRKSDMGITTNLGFLGAKSNYLGEVNKDNRTYLNFPNFGVAFCNNKDDLEEGTFRGGTFSMTYNKVNDFNYQALYSGFNRNNSIMTSFVELVNRNQVPKDVINGAVDDDNIPDLESLIYLSFLTDRDGYGKYYNPIDSTFNYENAVYYNKKIRSYPVQQEQTVNIKGGQNQFDFAYGGNFSDKFYLGGGVGIIRHRYLVNKDFYEKPIDSTGLIDLTFNQNFVTKGYGINFKIGGIYKLNDALRLSLNLQTPTWYSLTETYQYSIFANFNPNYKLAIENDEISPGVQNKKTLANDFKYSLTTPAIVRAGAAYIIGKAGFLTADIEYVPYSTIKLGNSESPSLFNGDNKFISRRFANGINFKGGGELRSDIFRLRGGYAYTADPMKDLDNINRSIHTITLGAGIRLPEFYFDVAIVNSRTNSFSSSYTLNSGKQPGAFIKNSNTGIMFSVGTSF